MRQKTMLGEKYLEITRGTPGGPKVARGRAAARRARSRTPSSSTRSSASSTRRRGGCSAPGSRTPARRSRTAASTSTTRSATCRASSATRHRRARGARPAGRARCAAWCATPASSFGALTERRGPAAQPDRQHRPTCSTATARQKRGARRDVRDLPDVPRRVARDDGRPRVVLAPGAPARARPAPGDRRTCAPTLRDVRALAPDLERLLPRPRPAHHGVRGRACRRCATCSTAREPLLGQLQPFLEELNPILEWLEYHQHTTADFFANGGGALVDTCSAQRTDDERGHYLGQFGLTGPESRSSPRGRRARRPRGNAYLDPTMLDGARGRRAS